MLSSKSKGWLSKSALEYSVIYVGIITSLTLDRIYFGVKIETQWYDMGKPVYGLMPRLNV